MQKPRIPENESDRFKKLLSYEVLDTEPEQRFDDLTWLASEIASVPIALVSLIDQDRQWFKSKVGLDAPCTSRDISFCGHAIHDEFPLLVEDASKDSRFADNPLVTGPPDIRFYMGAPLTTPDGFTLGTLCVIDKVPRKLTNKTIDMIIALARQVVDQLELRKAAMEMRTAARTAIQKDLAKTEFLACMSHEIRTPMNGIMGMTDLMLDTARDHHLKENLQVIKDSGSALLRHLNDVLDLTKVESGKIDFEMLDFHFEQQIKRILRPFEVIAANKLISLKYEYDPCLPTWVTADPVRIEQVLTNLVSNAVKFTAKGQVTVHITHAGSNEQGLQILFEVQDSGPGVPNDKQASIFEAYAQADASINRIHGGTGLGLPIAARLVEMMGGKLQLESEVGQGSRFYFTISMSPGDQPANDPQHTDKPQASKHVLVAEDNRINQVVVSKILKRLGHSVSIAQNGVEAVDMATSGKFDVIFMDIRMPEMDGFDATARIRAWQEQRDSKIPIVALTASLTDEERCTQAGMDGFLTKPVRVQSVKQALEQLQSGPSQTGQSECLPLVSQAGR